MYNAILENFTGREDVLAMQPAGSNFRPVERGPLTQQEFAEEHVGGLTCYGFYLMRPDNTVTCSCVDFDNHDDQPDPEWQGKADRFYDLLQQLDLQPVMEVSASGKGAHLWLFFSQPVPAWKVRKFWIAAGSRISYEPREIYPRQDQLRGKGLGNLVRLPLWNKSRFVDPHQNWEEVAPESMPRTPVDEFDDICISLSVDISSPPLEGGELSERINRLLSIPNSLLTRRWRGDTDGLKGDTSRSVIAFAICCELVYQHVPTEDIRAALARWCALNDYDKPAHWHSLTIDKAYDSVHTRLTKQPAGKPASTIAGCAQFFISRLGNTHHFSSGIVPLDYSIDGIAPGEVGILAARPGHCKSALALQWLDFQARSGVSCLMLNAEMSGYEIGRRMVMSLVGGEEEDWLSRRDEITEKIREYYSDCSPPLFESVGTIDDVEEKIKLHAANGVQLVAVDYLQLLRCSSASGRYEVVTEISQRIKGAARDNDVAILALCQVSRAVEQRDEPEFQSSDLRESGQLEQDADLIALGPRWGRTGSRDRDDYELHIVKRRNGPVRIPIVKVRFNSSMQKFHW